MYLDKTMKPFKDDFSARTKLGAGGQPPDFANPDDSERSSVAARKDQLETEGSARESMMEGGYERGESGN